MADPIRIAIQGPSASGKTTLAKIAARILSPTIPIIHGDDFIRQNSEDIDGLAIALRKHDSFIFEHISSGSLLLGMGCSFDLLITLKPKNNSELISQSHDLIQKYSSLDKIPIFITAGDLSAALEELLIVAKIYTRFPSPICNFVLKIASRCNLDCSYCYMYHGADTSWKDEPIAFIDSVASATANRLFEYAQMHPTKKLSIIFHGGEPLSIGKLKFERIVETIQTKLVNFPNCTFGVQTNGVLINEDYLDVVDRLGLSLGISLDGGTEWSNRHRVTKSGRSSFKQVEKAIKLCQKYNFTRGKFSGVLCVIDPDADGAETYNYFRALGVNVVDFLLRDQTHETESLSDEDQVKTSSFLISAFDAWFNDPEICTVRFFQSVIAQILGYRWSTDAIGLFPVSTLCVSTSGQWELLDVLRVCQDNACQTLMNVFEHSVSDVHSGDAFSKLLNNQYDLHDKCLRCNNLFSCGAGYLPNRFSKAHGFKNPSTHCKSLYLFHEHVRTRLSGADFAGQLQY